MRIFLLFSCFPQVCANQARYLTKNFKIQGIIFCPRSIQCFSRSILSKAAVQRQLQMVGGDN